MTRASGTSTAVTLVLGTEHDHDLLAALHRALAEAGAEETGHTWQVSGQQEVETWQYRLGRERISVQIERYVGLTLRGPAARVEALAAAVRPANDGR